MELRPVCDALQEQIDGLLAQALLVLLHVGEFIPLCKARRHVEADDGQVLGHAQTHGLRSAPDKPVDPISVRNLESRVFYPITFPISIGPGSISVIFTLMASVNIKDGLGKIIINYAVIAFVIFLMCLILYVILSQGQKITKKVGVTGTMIINKMVAFFTFCVGIQIIAEGVEKIFHLSLS